MRGFRYQLEPVRLTRSWALDALMVELGEANARLQAAQQEAVRLDALGSEAGAAWRALAQGGQALPADRFAQAARYVADCGQRSKAQAAEVELAARARDGLQEQVAAARRALDAVEEHRDVARQQFASRRLDGDIKVADEQWSAMKAMGTKHDDND